MFIDYTLIKFIFFKKIYKLFIIIFRDLLKCTTCDALFYNKKAYDNHNMYHKPDDLYVTSEAQRCVMNFVPLIYQIVFLKDGNILHMNFKPKPLPLFTSKPLSKDVVYIVTVSVNLICYLDFSFLVSVTQTVMPLD